MPPEDVAPGADYLQHAFFLTERRYAGGVATPPLPCSPCSPSPRWGRGLKVVAGLCGSSMRDTRFDSAYVRCEVIA